MKNVSLFLVLISSLLLQGCGGGSAKPDGPSPEEVCSEQVISKLDLVVELCAKDLSLDDNKNTCLKEAKELKKNHPNFECSFEGGVVFNTDFIEENYIKGIEEEEEIENSSIFD